MNENDYCQVKFDKNVSEQKNYVKLHSFHYLIGNTLSTKIYVESVNVYLNDCDQEDKPVRRKSLDTSSSEFVGRRAQSS